MGRGGDYAVFSAAVVAVLCIFAFSQTTRRAGSRVQRPPTEDAHVARPPRLPDPCDDLMAIRIPRLRAAPTSLMQRRPECFNFTTTNCKQRVQCFEELFCNDTRSDQSLMEDLLFRSRELERDLVSKGGIDADRLIAAAECDRASGTVVLLEPPTVRVIGRTKDHARVPTILQRLQEAVARQPSLFPTALFVLNAGDVPCDQHPVVTVYSHATVRLASDPLAALPLPMHFVIPDDTMDGMLFHNRPFPMIRIEPYEELVAGSRESIWTDLASDALWSMRRNRSLYFRGSPNNRMRKGFAKMVVRSPYTNVNVAHVMTRPGVDAMRAEHPMESAKHRVAFSARGFSASQRDKYSLAAGVGLLRAVDMDTEPSQFYHELLRPYVHFVPLWCDHVRREPHAVKCALHEVAALFELPAAAARVRHMARNNRRLADFISSNVTLDAFTAAVLQSYARSCRFDPLNATLHSALETNRERLFNTSRRAGDLPPYLPLAERRFTPNGTRWIWGHA